MSTQSVKQKAKPKAVAVKHVTFVTPDNRRRVRGVVKPDPKPPDEEDVDAESTAPAVEIVTAPAKTASYVSSSSSSSSSAKSHSGHVVSTTSGQVIGKRRKQPSESSSSSSSASLSSDTQEQRRLTHRSAKLRRAAATAASAAGSIPALTQHMPIRLKPVTEAQFASFPHASTKIESFEDFLAAYPELKPPDEESGATASSSSSSSAVKPEVMGDIDQRYLDRLLRKMPRSQHYLASGTAATNAEIADGLRKRRLVVPTLDFHATQALLFQAGPRMMRSKKLVDFPSCMYAKTGECVWQYDEIKGLPRHTQAQLKQMKPEDLLKLPHGMMLLYKHEHRDGVHTGRWPITERPCWACHNRNIDFLLMGLHRDKKRFKVKSGTIYHLFGCTVDQVSGYARQFVHPANPALGLIDPVPIYSASLLKAKKNDDGVYYLDQDDMKWTGPALPEPNIGERRMDFRQRVNHKFASANYAKQDDSRTAERIRRLQDWHDPRSELIRNMSVCCDTLGELTVPKKPLKTWREVKQVIRLIARRYEVIRKAKSPVRYSQAHAYRIAVTYDSFMRLISSFEMHTVSKEDEDAKPGMHPTFFEVCCEDTHADMTAKLHKSGLFANAEDKINPYHNLFLKIANRKCSTRRMFSVMHRNMNPPKERSDSAKSKADAQRNQAFAQDVLRWLVCSLLGNYRKVNPSDRPPIALRYQIYREWQDNGGKRFLPLFRKAQMVAVTMLREFLFFAVEGAPALHDCLVEECDWSAFEAFTRSTLRELRKLMYSALQRGWLLGSMSQDAQEEEFAKMNQVATLGHLTVLKVAYKRRRRPLPEEWFNICNQMNLETAKDRMDRAMKKLDPSDEPNLRMYPVQRAHIDTMIAVLERTEKQTVDHESLLPIVLEILGCPEEATQHVRDLSNLYYREHAGKKAIRAAVRQLFHRYPMTFSLVGCYSSVSMFLDGFAVYPLPHHYRVNQMRAVAESLQLPPEAPIPSSHFLHPFCPGCLKFYGLAVEFKKPCKGRCPNAGRVYCSRHHAPYDAGTDCAIACWLTGELFCHSIHPSLESNLYWPCHDMEELHQKITEEKRQRAATESTMHTLTNALDTLGAHFEGEDADVMQARPMDHQVADDHNLEFDIANHDDDEEDDNDDVSTLGIRDLEDEEESDNETHNDEARGDQTDQFETVYVAPDLNEYKGKHLKGTYAPEDPRSAKAKDHPMHTFLNICSRENRLSGSRVLKPFMERQKLREASLLDGMMYLDGKWYTICPQFACGRAMVYSPTQSVYTLRGFACARCSDKIRNHRVSQFRENALRCDKLSRLFAPQSCALCEKAISVRVDAYIYPCDMLLCVVCHKDAYLDICHEHPQLCSPQHKPELVQLFVKRRREEREKYEERNRAANEIRLKRQIRASRANKKGR